MNEKDVIQMRESALYIIKQKIDDITVNEAPLDPRSPADHVAFQAAKCEQAQLHALAALSTSLVFGMLAEVVMLRQAVQTQARAMEEFLVQVKANSTPVK